MSFKDPRYLYNIKRKSTIVINHQSDLNEPKVKLNVYMDLI